MVKFGTKRLTYLLKFGKCPKPPAAAAAADTACCIAAKLPGGGPVKKCILLICPLKFAYNLLKLISFE